MFIKLFIYLLLPYWMVFIATARAEESHLVNHIDVITIDPQLNLTSLIDHTLEKHPDYALVAALNQESAALNQRGNRWIAGAATASMDYKDDFIGSETGAHELEGAIEVPLWNWGQRDAGLKLAEQAELSAIKKANAIRLQVAGLVRDSLWTLKLESLRYEMQEKNFHLAEKLLNSIKVRVKEGDLPKSDFLLAESEFLQKKIQLVHAEAELMHARKRFYFLTQDNKTPAQINESQTEGKRIEESHPALAAINAVVAQKKAAVEWIKAEGSGQTVLAIGGNSDKPSRSEESVDSITFNISVPFGGRGYAAPEIAAAQREYVEAEIEKMHLYRHLLERLHEAKHELEIEKVQFQIATRLKSNADEHLKMAKLSFDAGETSLMDLLKIQARSQEDIKNAKESAIRLQRNIAFYNQALGVTP